MKKLLALAMTAVMLLTVSLALAENAKTPIVYDEDLTLNVVYPEGYEISMETDGMYLLMDMKKAGAAELLLLVCPDDEYAELERLNDLSEEDLAAYMAVQAEGYNAPEVTVMETEYGTKIIVINENDGMQDYAELVTVYQGHVIDLYISVEDETQVTDEDIAMAMKFLSDMDFVYTAL